jgi:hypothetical protein
LVILSDLAGLWQRSLLIRADGTRDTATQVWWLQGARLFIDLRRPANPPDFSGLRGLDDLRAEQCAWLAQQQGFSGRLVHDGICFEWQRSIDFQPDSLQPDAGTLHWEADVLVETGRDSPYVEHWHRDEHLRKLPTYSLALQAPDGGVRAALVRVGDALMFSRDREGTLPACHTLAECIAGACSLREMQTLLDCEISLAAIHDGHARITASTLPHRVGDVLAPHLAGDSLSALDRTRAGDLFRRHWTITAAEGQMDALQHRD